MKSGLSRSLALLACTVFPLSAGGCGGTSRPAATASPSASPSAASAGSLTNQALKKTPITFEAPKLGDKYVYLTKQRRDGRTMYALRADSEKGVYLGENTGQSTFVNPHITFYGSDGKRVVADAPVGIAVERAKTVQLTGRVHALSQDGVKLVSDQMLYAGSEETIHAQGHVVMDSPQGSELRGDTLDWNLHTGAVEVTGAH